MSVPKFWSQPLRYMRWASSEKPAIFYSVMMGCMGPVALVTLPPIRRYFGDVDPAPIPTSYPSTSMLRTSSFVVLYGTRPPNLPSSLCSTGL